MKLDAWDFPANTPCLGSGPQKLTLMSDLYASHTVWDVFPEEIVSGGRGGQGSRTGGVRGHQGMLSDIVLKGTFSFNPQGNLPG